MSKKQDSGPTGKRTSWLDESKQSTLIDEYAQKLSTFMAALADGHIEESELADQEKRVVSLMNEVDPLLDDAQHEKVTRLLCELTAYNMMQTIHSLQESKPKSVFRG